MAKSEGSILVVENDPQMLASLQQIFSERGYSVATASGGREAISMLGKQQFDLCVLDLIMPDITGQDVMDYICRDQKKINFVVLSADTNIDAAIYALSRRAFAFIRKPFRLHELLDTVADGVARNKLYNQRQNLRSKLRKSEKLYRYIADNSPDFVYVLDQNGNFIYLNARVESMLGVKPSELMGKHYSEIVCSDFLPSAKYRLNERRTRKRATRNLEICLKTQSNRRTLPQQNVPVELNAEGIYSYHEIGTKSLQGTLGVVRCVEERKTQDQQLSYLAYHDALTGLPNRILFNDRFDVALEQAKRGGYYLVVMFLDLDGFKQVNDSLGHGIGDVLLKQFSQRLKKGLRKADTVARFGGDEFVLMLPRLETLEYAEVIAAKIVENQKKPLFAEGHELVVSASIGISVFPDDGDSKESLLERADSAMFDVKKDGKTGFRFFSSVSHQPTNDESLKSDLELQDALKKKRFTLFYQPIFDRIQSHVIGLEALIRWWHPSRGLIFPDGFLETAEQTGAMIPIGKWVLTKACRELKNWDAKGLVRVKISVNVLACQLQVESFAYSILATLDSYGISCERLRLEIKQSEFDKLSDQSIGKLAQLKSHGIHIIVEDYQGDEASLAKLSGFPISALKLDCSKFEPQNAAENPEIGSSFLDKVKRLGWGVMVKNVENEQQIAMLQALELNTVQGFIYHHPVPAEAVSGLLNDETGMH